MSWCVAARKGQKSLKHKLKKKISGYTCKANDLFNLSAAKQGVCCLNIYM